MSAGAGDRPLVGIALAALAVFVFAIADTTTKYLTERYPVPFVVFVRYVVNLVLLLGVLVPRGGWAALLPVRAGRAILRGLCLASASLLMGFAVRLMPIGETLAIIYLQPFMMLFAARAVLGERVSPFGWAAAAVGFLGVLLIVRPGGGLAPAGVVLAVGCAAVSAGYNLMSRGLSRTETQGALLVSTAATGVAVFAVLLPWSWPPALPDAFDGSVLLGLGALAALGHVLLTRAYREAEASLVAPVSYLHLFWAAGLGWIVFDHLPEPPAAAGIALVAIAGALSAAVASRPRRIAAPAEVQR